MDFKIDTPVDATPAPYVHQPFPSWRYHRSGKTILVDSQDEHEALMASDPDWADTPAAFADDAPANPEHPLVTNLRAANEEIDRLKARIAELEAKGKAKSAAKSNPAEA